MFASSLRDCSLLQKTKWLIFFVSLLSFSEFPFPIIHIGDNQDPRLGDSDAFSLGESNTSPSCSSGSSKDLYELMIIKPLRERSGNYLSPNTYINKIVKGHGEWELRPDKFWRQSKNSYFSETYVWKNCLHVSKNENLSQVWGIYNFFLTFILVNFFFNLKEEEFKSWSQFSEVLLVWKTKLVWARTW